MRQFILTSALVSLTALLACGDDSSGGGGAGAAGGAGGAGAAGGAGGAGAAGGAGGAGAAGGAGGAGAAGGAGGAGGGVGANGPGFTCDAAEGAAPTLALTTITEDVDRPVGVRSPPGRPDTLFIWEQHQGTIVIFENGALLPTPFLDIGDLIRTGNEEGLLGLAFHPNYADNGRFFVHYSASGNGESRIIEYARSADPNVANATPVQTVLAIPTEESNHNGGALEFGNDGYLWISFGDGGGGGDPDCDAQDLSPTNLLGKLVRLDVDATPDANGYPAAPGNPGGNKYFHTGLRNPWRFSFDRCNGDLYIADVGQNQWEEIDVVTEAAGALNFGWPYREGAHDFSPNNGNCPGGNPALTEPIFEYDHSGGKCSITGGTVYRGTDIPGLRGAYFYGDACSGQVWMLTAPGGVLTGQPVEIDQVGSVASFGNDGNGNVYVADLAGAVFRIDQQ